MENITISALRCPDCGLDLEGFDRDVIFFCRSCSVGYQAVERGGLSKVRVLHQPPGAEVSPSSLIWLPMWAMKIESRAGTPEKEQKRAQMIIEDIRWVWVSAFRCWRASYFGDIGLLYTSKKLAPKLLPATRESVPTGCSTTITEAAQYPTPFLLSIVDRTIDVALINISAHITEYHLVSVPFIDEGQQIRDTQIDWKWPYVFIEDIISIRKISAANR